MARLAALPAAALVAMLGTASGHAEQVAADTYRPQFSAFADWMAEGLAFTTACAPADMKAKLTASWLEASGILVASFWANGLDAAFVNDVAGRLEAAESAAPAALACADQNAGSIVPATLDWVEPVTAMLGAFGLAVVERPPTAEMLAAVRETFATEVPLQARLLECIAATDMSHMPQQSLDWDRAVLAAAQAMTTAGFPRDEAVALATGALSTSIWHQADAASLPALRADCVADETWQNRLYLFESLLIRSKVETILGKTP